MPIVALRTAIEAKLNTVPQLAEVNKVHTDSIGGFPAATFEPSGHENEFFENTDNKRSYAFDIMIHQEMTQVGREAAIDILSAAVDAVIKAFDEDFNLGGATDFCFPIPSVWDEYTSGNAAVRVAVMTLVCVEEVKVVT